MAYSTKTSFLIMNPNKFIDNKLVTRISEFSDHYSHCEYIWNQYISNNNQITNITIVANKTASFSVIKLLKNFSNDFKNRVSNIFLINSQHNSYYEILNSDDISIFNKVNIFFNKESHKLYTLK